MHLLVKNKIKLHNLQPQNDQYKFVKMVETDQYI